MSTIQLEEFHKAHYNGQANDHACALEIKNLNVWHEQYHILKDINLKI